MKTMELSMNDMEMVNGGLTTDPDELLNATLNGWGAGMAIGAAAGTVFPGVGTCLGALVGGAAGSVTGLVFKIFGD